jgi:hypothetical protein
MNQRGSLRHRYRNIHARLQSGSQFATRLVWCRSGGNLVLFNRRLRAPAIFDGGIVVILCGCAQYSATAGNGNET